MPKLVAVTGATGFVGGHVARAFADAGWRVRILCRRLPLNPLLGGFVPEVIQGSLEDDGALRALAADADAVIHAAGAVRALDAVSFYQANAHGTERMVAAVRDVAPAARFVLVSSLSAREPTLSDYAGSKRAGEIELERTGGGLDWIILRPSAVYGPEDQEFLPFFRMARSGWLAAPANGSSRLSLIHGEDLGKAILATAESVASRQTFEVADGRAGGYTWPEIAAALGGAVGRPVRLIRVPRLPLAVIAAFVEARARAIRHPAMITRGKLRELWHPDWVANTSNLDQCINWTAQHTVEEGFFETAQRYRAAGLLAAAPL
jgi:nucleoside-diphosphate-sugar epimerase